MFRLIRISEKTSVMHSRLTTQLLSNEILLRNVSFKVKPAEDKVWREYRKEVAKVRKECKIENRKMLAEEKEKQKLYEEKFSFETVFGPAFQYADEVNKRQQTKRETAEKKQIEEDEEMKEELQPVREIEKLEKEQSIENILETESKKADLYITPANIEQTIEVALDNPIVTSFPFPQTKVIGDGKGPKNFDEKGDLITHESLPYIN